LAQKLRLIAAPWALFSKKAPSMSSPTSVDRPKERDNRQEKEV
jgi:hypothetical protein